ncbi:MAG: methylated-DNA--[protein]-cysteine S-methyltransferase [Phycisphaeraceae bacterium]|nr:methylated-DNA--[protein]-cysteine S-methyltransferase [Phycisphaerales bacterium]MCB9861214.1 methylated-DNA--[protein]-cysteine S-methyltransferase [Phycisphaeraceae bacterium]
MPAPATDTIASAQLNSPLGIIRVTARTNADGTAGVSEVAFDKPNDDAPDGSDAPAPLKHILNEAIAQLHAYFASSRSTFDLPLAAHGTDFQHTVWRELCSIPAGITISYGELAKRVGGPNYSRAVGAANGANPIAIIVPCHRVIDSQGKLHGYAGGLERKRWLIDHERAMCGATLFV